MKITINVDCSPEEARIFMGLPDVKPVQEALLKEIEKQALANMKAMSPEVILNTWFPTALQNAGETQKTLLTYLQTVMTGMSTNKKGA